VKSRQTNQKKAVRWALVEADRPLNAHEVLVAARRVAAGLGIATVYRNLRALVADGWLAAVDLPGEPRRYERAGKDHHHHFHCRSCDRVFEVPECPVESTSIAPDGFLLERHDVVLYGRCADCVEARR